MVSQAEGLYATEVEGQVVLMSLAGGECFGLNHVAALLWQKMETAVPISSLIDGCVQQFDAPRHQIAADVVRVFDELQQRGLIQVLG